MSSASGSSRVLHGLGFSVFLLLFTISLRAAETSSDSTSYDRALTALAARDTVGALGFLDQALEADSQDWQAHLTRGRLLLALGRLDDAEADFRSELNSPSPVQRSAAHLGLGDVLRAIPKKKMEAIKEYKLAAQVDPSSLEVLYQMAQLGFDLGEATGYDIADNALTELVSRDATYRDTYRLWREKIKGHSVDNRRKVDQGLAEQIARNPTLDSLWLDIAIDRFDLFETDNCLAALDSLGLRAPQYKPQDRLLLHARCLLERDDTTGFMQDYFQALLASVRSGDFTRLSRDAELIFTPDEEKAYSRLKTAREKAAFFRVFWLNKDPDPVTFLNERLVEHYRRLRTAQKDYPLLSPDGLSQSSESYMRLLSLPEKVAVDFKDIPDPEHQDYDPVHVFGHRGEGLGLDHRGLIYVRHGPPNFVNRRYIWERRDGFLSGDSIPNAVEWVYWPNKFVFKTTLGAGGYIFWPDVDGREIGIADVAHAMQTQTFKEPLKALPQDHYEAEFLRRDGSLELESYQSVPLSETKAKVPPPAWLVLYDRSLLELARDSTTALSVAAPEGGYWLAVNRLLVTARDYSFVLSVGLPDRRSVVKENLKVAPLTERRLSLSGIVVGSPPPPGGQSHSRLGVPLRPRPSRTFGPAEVISVYLEVYGLLPAADRTRGYRERVTVSLVEEKKSLLKAILSAGGKNRTGSRTLSFERRAESPGFAVPERFDIDASELLPGRYSLEVELRDLNADQAGRAANEFSLE